MVQIVVDSQVYVSFFLLIVVCYDIFNRKINALTLIRILWMISFFFPFVPLVDMPSRGKRKKRSVHFHRTVGLRIVRDMFIFTRSA